MLLWLSSGVEPGSVAVGEVVAAASAEFEFPDAGWPHVKGCRDLTWLTAPGSGVHQVRDLR